MSEPRLNTILAVVVRPDHQCGGDLVDYYMLVGLLLGAYHDATAPTPLNRRTHNKFKEIVRQRSFTVKLKP